MRQMTFWLAVGRVEHAVGAEGHVAVALHELPAGTLVTSADGAVAVDAHDAGRRAPKMTPSARTTKLLKPLSPAEARVPSDCSSCTS